MKTGIFIGLAGLDIIYYQDYTPTENFKSKTNDYMVNVGGPAANAAITYSILGGKARLITCIGNSTMGRMIKGDLEHNYQIDVIDLAKNSDELPGISSILVNNKNANRTIWSGQQIFETLDDVIAYEFNNIDFIFSDCNLGLISEKIIKYSKTKDIPIILDVGSWKDNMEFYLSNASDVIASNDCLPPSGNDFFTIARSLGARNIAVTNGENNIKWDDSINKGEISPPMVKAKDTLGAGDVFHGAYCYFKINNNLSFLEALQEAAKVASKSVEYKGAREGVEIFKSK